MLGLRSHGSRHRYIKIHTITPLLGHILLLCNLLVLLNIIDSRQTRVAGQYTDKDIVMNSAIAAVVPRHMAMSGQTEPQTMAF